MRVSKEHNERREEILDKAEQLFSSKGYEKCTVNDILNAVGIAKGTFYHYFKSKEEVLDAIIQRVTDIVVSRAKLVASDQTLSPDKKLLHIFLSMRVENEMNHEILEELHQTENALMHQKSLSSIMEGVVPILAQVAEEGIEKGMFHSDFPAQYMQIFLVASVMLLDDGIFQIEKQEQQLILKALVTLLEKMLGLPQDYLWNAAAEHWK